MTFDSSIICPGCMIYVLFAETRSTAPVVLRTISSAAASLTLEKLSDHSHTHTQTRRGAFLGDAVSVSDSPHGIRTERPI